MPGKKYIIPLAVLVGAVSMIAFQAFAQGTSAPTTTVPAQVQTTTQAPDDNNASADIETNDEKGTSSVSDTDTETKDDGGKAGDQNDQQDPGQTDGETND